MTVTADDIFINDEWRRKADGALVRIVSFNKEFGDVRWYNPAKGTYGNIYLHNMEERYELIPDDERLKRAQAEFQELVLAERRRAIGLGYDTEHDDTHGLDCLFRRAQEYLRRGKTIQGAALMLAAQDYVDRNYGAERR
jgi:hypothetical protein